MENKITAKQYSKALSERRILITGTKYTTNGWTEFRVFELKKPKHKGLSYYNQILVEDASYYNKKNWNYRCIAWGTDRRLEIILSIGYALGCSFNEMPQRYEWLQN